MSEPKPPWYNCEYDHCCSHSYLLSTRVESIAPPVILTRVLQNYREMELTDRQIRRLLDIAKTYHDKSMKVSIEFTKVTSELEAGKRHTTEKIKQLLNKHAKLFLNHESLIVFAYEKIQKVLTDKQIRKSRELYQSQMQITHTRIKSSLRKVLAPALDVVLKKRK